MQSPVLGFDKNCTQNAYFLQKVDFSILEPNNCEVIENSSKTPLNFSTLQCTYLGKIHFNVTRAKSEKKKLKSGYLELRFSIFIMYYINSIILNNEFSAFNSILILLSNTALILFSNNVLILYNTHCSKPGLKLHAMCTSTPFLIVYVWSNMKKF